MARWSQALNRVSQGTPTSWHSTRSSRRIQELRNQIPPYKVVHLKFFPTYWIMASAKLSALTAIASLVTMILSTLLTLLMVVLLILKKVTKANLFGLPKRMLPLIQPGWWCTWCAWHPENWLPLGDDASFNTTMTNLINANETHIDNMAWLVLLKIHWSRFLYDCCWQSDREAGSPSSETAVESKGSALAWPPWRLL